MQSNFESNRIAQAGKYAILCLFSYEADFICSLLFVVTSRESDPTPTTAGRLRVLPGYTKENKHRKPESVFKKYFYLGQKVYIRVFSTVSCFTRLTHSNRLVSFDMK
jgi:hypothetical protein